MNSFVYSANGHRQHTPTHIHRHTKKKHTKHICHFARRKCCYYLENNVQHRELTMPTTSVIMMSLRVLHALPWPTHTRCQAEKRIVVLLFAASPRNNIFYYILQSLLLLCTDKTQKPFLFAANSIIYRHFCVGCSTARQSCFLYTICVGHIIMGMIFSFAKKSRKKNMK